MSRRTVPLERLAGVGLGTRGLSTEQVDARRGDGFNDIVVQTGSGWRAIARETARDPMLWFLVLTAGLFGLLGQITESLTLLVALVPLLGMDAYLHRRTSASSAGLASRLASSARVSRDGQWREIPSRELVPGDLVEVVPGEYFPADGLLVSGTGLQVDESTLTGESLPVAKRALDAESPLPASASDEHWGTAGTRLLTGTARLRIVFIGGETRYGEIVRSATEGSHAATPLQQAIAELVAVLIGLAVVMCVVLAAIRLWHGHGWIDAVLSAVTLAVAALPEEFPVVYTFFLGVGVFRLARRNALVRRAVAVENIGRVSCIVSDKTGTITAGSLVLAHRAPAAGVGEDALLEAAAFASRPDSGDPLDQALRGAAGPLPPTTRLADFPFTEARRRETVVLRRGGADAAAFTKGAPETVLATCALTESERAGWLARVEEYALSGHKVIACAMRRMPSGASVDGEPQAGFEFIGLLAFEDPVREGVRDAVAECIGAGMRVIMVTGDHPATAAAIAREIGLGGARPTVVVLAPDDDAGARLGGHRDVHVVARATPPQKLALVQALQAQGELVAVTGDGVNDVPALRLADIGVAMGERGTRSAREVAPVVLLDDNFRTIVDAVAEGRQLFQNLRLAFAYLLLVHLPLVIGAAAIPLMGLPLLFLPVHIVWLELVIHPTAMLAFQDLPSAGPLAPARRRRRARFFSADSWLAIVLVGSLVSVAVVWSYLHALGADRDVEHARAMALSLLLTASAGLTTGLTKLRQATARWLVAGTLASLGALVQVPMASRLLSLRPLHAADGALLVATFAACAVLALGAAASLGRQRD
ncbi:cation-translocating P-type ATPase [Piscinibacter defluvii]|uniref:cation-translocating P-type ATPase n=1 Tax=Piscinibacter defluvii TaxID=1796922 RepID=UPI000FDEEAAC|nr:cation-transporting P-type ATPase [Piscinibacter defluvii]